MSDRPPWINRAAWDEIQVGRREEARHLEERNRLRDEYDALHRCCPSCLSGDLYVTTAGFPPGYDGNRAACVCGWKGIVHDLVPAPEQEPSA